MTDEEKTKEHLKNELVELRQRITELEASETQQKRDKAILKTLSVQWQTTFDVICDAVCLMDKEGRILQCNKAMMQLLGKSSDELIGRTCYELMHGTSKRPEECPVIRMQETRRRENLVLRLDDRWYNVTVDPLLDDDGSINGAVHIIADITERKQAEEEVKKSKQMLEEITQGITESILLLSKDLRILWANKAALVKYGYELKDIIGKYCYMVTHRLEGPCEPPLDPCPIYELQETDTSQTQTHTHFDMEGNEYFVEVIAYPIKDDKGEVVQFVYVSKDITEHKRAEEALKESEGKYRRIVETAHEGIWVLDVTSKTTYVNQRMAKMLGYTEQEMRGRSLFNFMDEDARIAAERNVERRKEGITEVHDFRFRRKDGSDLWTIISTNPFFDDDGQYIGTLGMITDITQRKQAEEALRDSEERYRGLYESSIDGIAYADIEEKIVDCNQAFADLHGFSKEELYNLTFWELTPLKWHDMSTKIFVEQVLPRGYSDEFEKEHIKKDGTIFPISIRVWLIKNNEGNPIGSWAVVRDITEKRKMEEELLKIEKLESLGILAGGIAHDFNNILTGILGNISLAKQYAQPEDKVFERLIEAEKASIRAKDLTFQLLTFAKGGAPIKKTVSITELFKETTIFALSGSNVRAEFSLPEEIWLVEADEGQLNQVIHNIVINADQSMPEGGIITVSAENITLGVDDALPLPEGNYVKITMQDQGIGIPKDHLAKIFDPYFTTKHKGSGLGLTVAYSTIKSHEGHITVDSELGVGTTFAIYLPASEKPIPTKKEEEGLVVGKGKILVMDDEEVVRETLGEILGYLGYQVEFVKNGEEAILLYEKFKDSDQPFNAVILDLTIPGGMGGKEAIKQLIELDSDVKAVVSSGYSTDPVMANFRDYGFRGVVAKPYDIKELSEILHKVIKGNDE